MHPLRTLSLTLACSLAAAPTLASHDESIGARFVQPGGRDTGNCLDHDSPCVSIQYALAQAEPGHTVKVGDGIFDLSGIDPESYLYGPIRATGGYSDADHFFESRPNEVRSVVVGVDPRYRNALAVRGFYWAESAAAAARGEIALGGGTALQAAQQAESACTQGFAGQFPCKNLDFLAQMPLSSFSTRPLSAANVWGFRDLNNNREYAVLGLRNGTAIVDVTDPVNPREVATVAGNSSTWREVKVYQVRDAAANRWRAYAYVTTEASNSGLQTIDLSGLPQSAVLASTNLDTGSQHTLYVSNVNYATNIRDTTQLEPVLYLAGSNLSGGAWRAYSLANPAAPQLLASAPSTRYMHDSTGFSVVGTRAAQCAPGHDPCEVLVDFNVDQVELWDVTNKLGPVLLSTATNPSNRYIHSGWPNPGATHVFFHDELEEIQFGQQTRLYTLDATNLRAPTVTVSHQGPTTTTDHNGYTHGQYYYVSHYRRGVVVYDTFDPNNLVEVGHFDNYLTPSANSAGTDGAWGVYPFLPSGTLLVSDIENGLFVLRDNVRGLRQNIGRLGFAEPALNVAEDVGTANVRVQRVVGQLADVTVQYAVTSGSATEALDFAATSGTLSWSAGDRADKLIAIPIVNDTGIETAETLTVTLSAPTNGAALDGSSTLTVTIADNDAAPPPPPPSGGGGGGGGGTGILWLLLLAATLPCRRRFAGTHARRVT